MPNSRSIPEVTWVHVRKSLVLYFCHNHGWDNAQDLAQYTLSELLRRDDYEFDTEEDFLRVCFAFARNISKHSYRQQVHRNQEEALFDLPATESNGSLSRPELTILLEQVCDVGKTHVKDWDLLLESVTAEGLGSPLPGRTRARIYRARKQLARLVGWGK